MSRPTYRKMVLAIAVIAVVTIGVTRGDSEAATKGGSGDFCRTTILPRTQQEIASNKPSKIVKDECFESESEAVASLSGFTLLRLWADSGYGGAWKEWASAIGCAGNYGVDDFNPIGWNDRAGSAEPFCGRSINLWEHTFQSGARLTFSTDQSSLGVLDDESSSWDTAD